MEKEKKIFICLTVIIMSLLYSRTMVHVRNK
jgi:hypothetical protein